MRSIRFTRSVGSASDVSSGFMFWSSAPYVLSGLNMDDAVYFLVFYYQIVKRILLNIRALICLNIVLYNPISLLYCSIILPPNLLWYFYNIF